MLREGTLRKAGRLGRRSPRCATPIFVFLLAVLVTLGTQAALPGQFSNVGATDFATRDLPIARSLIEGQPFINRDLVFSVGFPLIVAGLIYVSHLLSIPLEMLLRVFAAFEMGLTTLLIFFLTSMIGSARRAWFASVLWLTYPFALWLTTQNGTELSFLLFFLAGLVLYWHALIAKQRSGWEWIFAGILEGASILIRPIAIGVPLILVFVLLFKRERNWLPFIFRGALFLFGFLAMLVPWEIFVF